VETAASKCADSKTATDIAGKNISLGLGSKAPKQEGHGKEEAEDDGPTATLTISNFTLRTNARKITELVHFQSARSFTISNCIPSYIYNAERNNKKLHPRGMQSAVLSPSTHAHFLHLCTEMHCLLAL